MKAINIFCLVLITSLSIVFNSAIAQSDLMPDGTRISDIDLNAVVENTSESGENGSTISPMLKTNFEQQNQTDEYGGVNGGIFYMEGLGATGDYLNVPHDGAFNQNVDGSIDAWVYVTSTGVQMIVAKGATQATVSFALFVGNTNKLGLRIGNSIVGSDDANDFPLNTWTHVAVTWDDNGGGFDVRFYIDGIQSGTTQNLAGTMPLNTDDMRIGSSEYNNGSFHGYIDEVRFWNPVLSITQIRSNRFIGLGEALFSNFDGTNFDGSESYDGLISSWTFNSGFLSLVFDNVGGHNGTLTGNADYGNATYGNPLPYNNALYFPTSGGNDNLVNIRDTTTFDNFITTDGTIEMWVRLSSIPGTTTHFISKGSTGPTNTFLFGLSGSSPGKLFFNIAGNAVTSTGPAVPTSDWSHIAVTWNDIGSNILVKFYLNGELNDSLIMNTSSIPTNNDPIRLGVSQAFPGGSSPVNTYFDGIRIWNEDMQLDSLRKIMFATTSAIADVVGDARLLASWEFDGNLVPAGRFHTMRGTFSTGTTNNCRFSSYTNESSSTGSVLTLDLFGHPTTIKRPGTFDPAFPYGSYIHPVFENVPDNNPSGISDVITVGPSFPENTVTSVELFLSVEGSRVGDLQVTLTAPNGQERTVVNNHGGTNNHIHTIFYDGAAANVTSTEFVAPWSHGVQPFQAFGDFSASPTHGDWTLKVSDGTAGTTHTLLGWGIRLNGQTAVGIQQITSQVPQKYELSQNYPNPFNPSTSIKFALPKSSLVTLKIYDIVGREVATLVNQELNAGTFEYSFDGSKLTSGVYFYRIDAGDFTEIKKMMLVK